MPLALGGCHSANKGRDPSGVLRGVVKSRALSEALSTLSGSAAGGAQVV